MNRQPSARQRYLDSVAAVRNAGGRPFLVSKASNGYYVVRRQGAEGSIHHWPQSADAYFDAEFRNASDGCN